MWFMKKQLRIKCKMDFRVDKKTAGNKGKNRSN